MKKGYRLDSVARGFAEVFLQAPSSNRRAALVAACEMGLRHSRVMDPLASRALETIRSGGSATPTLRRELAERAARLDEAYLSRCDEDGSAEAEALEMFSKARAFASLAYALGEGEDWLEALYEAVSTVDEQGRMVERLSALLKA
ncbi:hypothetical protein OWM54_22375 [Myxococcus sp. MISCRS1]|uniref:hypothetical protein n=1 Tax=Myxococcus sp. MISCRS1 TaxID=2996786 RepID=UPI002271C295|nr:hypothetical protein [Myxococcus sp. MISCRS1]MCY0999885.1 hypothetical protein [Myxococcus sp. MISCRS1]